MKMPRQLEYFAMQLVEGGTPCRVRQRSRSRSRDVGEHARLRAFARAAGPAYLTVAVTQNN